MMNRIEQFADTLKTESLQLADRAISGLRSASMDTAKLISRTKGPVHAFGDTGLKLNNLSHKSIEKLLKLQVAALDDLIDGSAHRLEMAAKSKDVKTLVKAQVNALPKSREHAMANARKTVTLVRDTGDAFGDLFKDVVVDISSARSAKKAPARKRPAAKKAAAKKRSTKKTAAKKRTTRKASAKKSAAKKSTSKAA